MSEFTDYMQLRTHAPSLAELEKQLLQSVGMAEVPLFELPASGLDSKSAAEAAWAALPKPMWVMLGVSVDIAELAKIGLAFNLLVEEDFSTWMIALQAGDALHMFSVIADGSPYREATLQYGDVAQWTPDEPVGNLKTVADLLNVSPDALAKTLIPDGGQEFSKLLGAAYEQMENLNDPDVKAGQIEFGYSV